MYITAVADDDDGQFPHHHHHHYYQYNETLHKLVSQKGAPDSTSLIWYGFYDWMTLILTNLQSAPGVSHVVPPAFTRVRW